MPLIMRPRRGRGDPDPGPGVVSRRSLTAHGFTRDQVQAMLDADRWQRAGSRSIALYTGPLPEQARWAAAVTEAGPHAALGGTTALRAAGASLLGDETVHVWTPKSTRPGRLAGVRVHESRRWTAEDVLDVGVRRMRPAVAAVQAALWARSNRQAVLFLCLPVQQRIVTVASVAETVERIVRDRRRLLLRAVVADFAHGAQSLGELDLATLGRRRGWPEPTRQAVRRGERGRLYLDVAWERYGVVVEVDGIGHLDEGEWLADAFRQNTVILGGERVLRIPVLALRTGAEPYLRQVDAALRAGGAPCVRAMQC